MPGEFRRITNKFLIFPMFTYFSIDLFALKIAPQFFEGQKLVLIFTFFFFRTYS